MRAIVRSGYGGPEVLHFEDVPIPVPRDDEVLVRVHASSVNMADVDYLLGRPKIARLGTGRKAPRNRGLGLDVAGVVEQIGPDVERLTPGDEVFGDLTNFGFGAYAEYVCAPEKAFAVKPTELTFEEAAAVPQAAVMALQGLSGKPSIEPGDEVLINGAGGTVGPFAVQIAKSLGATVTGVDAHERLDLVRTAGADRVLDFAVEDYTKTGDRYQRIFDIAPYHSIWASRHGLLPGGTYLMIPATVGQTFRGFVTAPLISVFGNRRLGVLPWKPFDQNDVAFLKTLLASRQVVPLIDRIYPLEQVAEALRDVLEGRARGKVIITM